MAGEVFNEIEKYYKSIGLNTDGPVDRIKKRSIRIQLSLRGINLAKYSANSHDAKEEIQKVKETLQALNIQIKAS